jgi:hypothetical protein
MIEQFKITQRLERQKEEDEAARLEVIKNQELGETTRTHNPTDHSSVDICGWRLWEGLPHKVLLTR